MAFQQALSGLNSAAKAIDATSHNIANSSTVGFKSSSAHFGDVYAASLNGAGASQIGIGVNMSAVQQQFTQGNITATNNPLDISINGAGFFRMDNNGAATFSRNGQFHLDKNGYIINDQGMKLTGYAAQSGIVVPSTPTPIMISASDLPPIATGTSTSGSFTGVKANLNFDSRIKEPIVAWGGGTPGAVASAVYTSLGTTEVAVASVLALAPLSAAASAAATVARNAIVAAEAVPPTGTSADASAAAVAAKTAADAAKAAADTAATANAGLPDPLKTESAAAAIAASTAATNAAAVVTALAAGLGASAAAATAETSATDAQIAADAAAADATIFKAAADAGATVSAAGGTPADVFTAVSSIAGLSATAATDAATAAQTAAAQTVFAPDPQSYNYSTALSVYDTLGNAHTLTIFLERVDPPTTANTGEWKPHFTVDGTAEYFVDNTTAGNIVFDNKGVLIKPTGGIVHLNIDLAGSMAALGGSNSAVTPLSFDVNFTGSTQFGSAFGTNRLEQDGYAAGHLVGLSASSDGVIQGRYSNGQTFAQGQIVLANFTNPNGLQALGNNQWTETSASGPALVGAPNTSSLGALSASTVEESNVDLTAELVNLITQQRNYQANAQSIKTQDQIMQTLVNLR